MNQNREKYEYTWKIGVEANSSAILATDRPLSEDVVLVDLYNGKKYWVEAVHAAKESDSGSRSKPVAHTWPVGSVQEDELSELRAKARYVRDEYSLPLADIVLCPRPDF
jgi:hypothetical protein